MKSKHFTNLLLGFCLLFFLLTDLHATLESVEHKKRPNILILSGPNYVKVVNSLDGLLPEEKFNTKIIYIKKEEAIDKIDGSIDFIITVGREATLRTNHYLASIPKAAPQLAVLIPHRMYNRIESELKDNVDKTRKITAIYREQPVDRQINLITKLLPDAKTIGVLTSMYDPNSIIELKQAVMKKNLNLMITENKKREDLIDSLKNVLSNSDVLLTLPDPEIYNPFTAKGILVTSFRRGIPLIGYSKTYVDAGAVAAVYTRSSQIAQQAAAITNHYFTKNTILPPSYPAQYSIAMNQDMLLKLAEQRKRRSLSKLTKN